MIVHASGHPGPALWQGIMFLALAVWATFIFSDVSQKAANRATVVLVVFGIVLAAAIMHFIG